MSLADAVNRSDLLSGKAALVTGGASGIGLAIARIFRQNGAEVAIFDIDAAAGRLSERDASLRLTGDASQSRDCRQAVDRTLNQLGRLDILVNSAGIIGRANVVELDEAEWDAAIAVNLKSVFLLCRLAIPVMAKQGGGSVINIGSGWGLRGGPRAAAYCASKGAVVQLTRAMAIDHGRENIRVNCICPGDTDTPMLRREAEQLRDRPERYAAASAAGRPLGRIGQPEDIARAALFLASDRSSFVTGTALVVDGGGLAG